MRFAVLIIFLGWWGRRQDKIPGLGIIFFTGKEQRIWSRSQVFRQHGIRRGRQETKGRQDWRIRSDLDSQREVFLVHLEQEGNLHVVLPTRLSDQVQALHFLQEPQDEQTGHSRFERSGLVRWGLLHLGQRYRRDLGRVFPEQPILDGLQRAMFCMGRQIRLLTIWVCWFLSPTRWKGLGHTSWLSRGRPRWTARQYKYFAQNECPYPTLLLATSEQLGSVQQSLWRRRGHQTTVLSNFTIMIPSICILGTDKKPC